MSSFTRRLGISPRRLGEALSAGGLEGAAFIAADRRVAFADAAHGTVLGGRCGELAGRRVLIHARDQLTAALALVELDGVARCLLVCPPDVREEHFAVIARDAGIDAVVTDRPDTMAALGIVVPDLRRGRSRLVSALQVAARGITRTLSSGDFR